MIRQFSAAALALLVALSPAPSLAGNGKVKNIPPGQAKKATGIPPGLAKKPGAMPPGQYKNVMARVNSFLEDTHGLMT